MGGGIFSKNKKLATHWAGSNSKIKKIKKKEFLFNLIFIQKIFKFLKNKVNKNMYVNENEYLNLYVKNK